MRRYGENVTPEESAEEQPGEEKVQFAKVLYGVCGWGIGRSAGDQGNEKDSPYPEQFQ